MEDLAYLYLALHEGVERYQSPPVATRSTVPSAWAAPVQADRTFKGKTHRSDQNPGNFKVQESDSDFECPAYPSFYL